MGLDKIHNSMLKNLNTVNRNLLLTTLNTFYRNGFVPEEWNCAIVVPILKPNPAGSYRPVSLTSCLGKVMERMINS